MALVSITQVQEFNELEFKLRTVPVRFALEMFTAWSKRMICLYCLPVNGMGDAEEEFSGLLAGLLSEGLLWGWS